MRWLRVPITIVLVLLLLFDAFIVLRLYLADGYHVIVQAPDGSCRVKVISPGALDWFLLSLLVAVHGGVIVLVRRSWRSGEKRVP